MRENRPYGSEGGVGKTDPDPYHSRRAIERLRSMGPGSAPRFAWLGRDDKQCCYGCFSPPMSDAGNCAA